MQGRPTGTHATARLFDEPLVGRDGEFIELARLLDSPQVRLVTLTGPGGIAKTRLALEMAQRLREQFPDGVYFVPLAAVTTAVVMWTTIAEALDVPPEGRIPPGFFDHVAQRTALFVLHNLEQVHGVDEVVAELLDHAPQPLSWPPHVSRWRWRRNMSNSAWPCSRHERRVRAASLATGERA